MRLDRVPGDLSRPVGLSVPVATVVTVVTTYLSFRQNRHPLGLLFPVFAFSAVAAAPGTLDTVPVAAVVAGGWAVFSWGSGMPVPVRPVCAGRCR
ncbi:hypothetical protein [Nocardia brevicatena]|uniref:hypothetical protein n=1 Tax=Nocardia brevicatena TaxID=37327 RepID=UPI0003189A8B|nr:hypothetical protein [Nocardia brevicatena]